MIDFNTVTRFEQTVADFFGAGCAVAVDCCTHGIELLLRYHNIRTTSCPTRTYLSVPMTLKKLNIEFTWSSEPWAGYYGFAGTTIIDAASWWRAGGYVPGTEMVLSFQYQKPLKLGRGGMILLEDPAVAEQLRRMSYDGRTRGQGWQTQAIEQMGYHYYMTPETADQGLKKFQTMQHVRAQSLESRDYPDLSTLPVFVNEQ